MRPFGDYAERYWRAGIPVMPLRERSKAAFLPEWQTITLDTIQPGWLSQYANGNIGLPLGHGTGFCAVDLDTDDSEVERRLRALIPETLYLRTGKKGWAAIYRMEGPTPSRRIRGADGMVVEFLGERAQLVLPPSIHPDTGQPYQSSVDLWDVVNDLPTISPDIGEVLAAEFAPAKRTAPKTKAATVGGRHNDMTGYLGSLRGRGIADPAEIAALALARNAIYTQPLPDDEVQAIVRAAAEDWEGGDGLPFTDYGNAVRLVRRLDGKARFITEWKMWAVWSGCRWVPDTDGFVSRKAKEVGLALTGEVK